MFKFTFSDNNILTCIFNVLQKIVFKDNFFLHFSNSKN